MGGKIKFGLTDDLKAGIKTDIKGYKIGIKIGKDEKTVAINKSIKF